MADIDLKTASDVQATRVGRTLPAQDRGARIGVHGCCMVRGGLASKLHVFQFLSSSTLCVFYGLRFEGLPDRTLLLGQIWF